MIGYKVTDCMYCNGDIVTIYYDKKRKVYSDNGDTFYSLEGSGLEEKDYWIKKAKHAAKMYGVDFNEKTCAFEVDDDRAYIFVANACVMFANSILCKEI